jgi:uncharacterized protein (TIGR02246 family)
MSTEASARPLVVRLSIEQLAAYNRQDLDAFCACFHANVIVLGSDGTVVHRGLDAFRAAYGAMFEAHRDVHAEVEERIVLGEHVVELERWSRVSKETGVRASGTVIVRYSESDGRLAVAEFDDRLAGPAAAVRARGGHSRSPPSPRALLQ